MGQVGIRALKQNASAVVAAAAAGEVVTITDRGRPVAKLTAIGQSPLAELLESGQARPAKTAPSDLPQPISAPALTPHLQELRQDER